MKRRGLSWRGGWHAALAMALCSATGGCAPLSRGFLAAAGPVAAAEKHEFIVVCLFLLLVIGPVLVLTPLIAWHYRLANTRSAFRPNWGFSWWLEGLIWIPPTIIVVILAILLWKTTHALDPYRPLQAGGPPLQVEVVSLDWKWLFIYPEQNLATVDQLMLPAGQPVTLSLTSGTVMQSFFVPRLSGQIYAMAGMTTKLNLAASRPGVYWGENTQFNGDGFQNQKFQVQVLPPAEFAAWVTQAKTDSKTLDAAAYQDLSRESLLPHAETFGKVDDMLFMQIVKQRIQPGYREQRDQESAAKEQKNG